MRQLVLRGAPFSDAERVAVLNYCQTDVDSLAKLLPSMISDIDLPGVAPWPLYDGDYADGMVRRAC